MPPPPRSDDQKRAIKARIEAKLREGFRPAGIYGPGKAAQAAAADEAVQEGEFRTIAGFNHAAGELRGTLLEPDWALWRPAVYQQPMPSFVVTPAPHPEPALLEQQGPGERVLVIGDLHQDPRHPDRLQVLTWIARHASEQGYGRVIQIGDWSSNDSVSIHDRNETHAGRFKPKIKDDLENLVASHQAWRRGMADGYRPKQHVTYGNHEERFERFENLNPESHGVYTTSRDETFAQFGWMTRRYGEILYVEGVGFTHHPINAAGRAYGGKTGAQRGANDSTITLVGGHTHKRQLHDSPKIGPTPVISFIEIGCALPWGVVENYAKLATTGWWWGVVPMTVHSGLATDVAYLSMKTIRDRYSDDGADVRS